jgi:HAD superfamily phosphoserine phosphatase-like hydrolase
MPKKGQLVALWDVDGTLLESSLERRFLRWLRANGHVSLPMTILAAAGRALTGRWQWHQHKLAYLRGRSVNQVTSLAGRCWREELVGHLRPAAVDVVRQLQKSGVEQILLSGSPRPLAECVASHLELANVIAAEPEIIDRHYTGGLAAPHPRGRRKVTAAAAWLERHARNWEGTIALADHYDDRFLLERVTTAIAVFPDRRLEQLAKRRGWMIVQSDDDFATLPEFLIRG